VYVRTVAGALTISFMKIGPVACSRTRSEQWCGGGWVTVGDDECVLRLLPSDHFPSEHGALSYLHAALNCTMCSVHATCWSRTMRPTNHGRCDNALSGRDQRQAKASLELRQSFVDTSCQETKTRKDVDTVGSRPILLIICCRLVATGWSSLHLLRSKVVISSGASDELRPGGPSLFH
jgi:hypothetical protein